MLTYCRALRRTAATRRHCPLTRDESGGHAFRRSDVGPGISESGSLSVSPTEAVARSSPPRRLMLLTSGRHPAATRHGSLAPAETPLSDAEIGGTLRGTILPLVTFLCRWHGIGMTAHQALSTNCNWQRFGGLRGCSTLALTARCG